MKERIVETVCKQLTAKLQKFNAPTDDVEEIVRKASESHFQSETALKTWATKIYFRKHPDIADKIHVDWHYAK